MSSLEITRDAARILSRLEERLPGRVVLPGDEGWHDARAAWDLTANQRPAAVVMAATPEDVVEAVNAARAAELRVAAQATGHAAGALPGLADAILLKTSRLPGVELDVAGRRARVGAGTVWEEVTDPASKAGLAPLAGSSPNVGVAGYTLCGGLSWLARRHGLAANSVTALDVVTADGRRRRVDRDHDPNLFWALRGGGGSFGVVTGLEFRLYPVPELYAGWLAWPWERANEVLLAWLAWQSQAPDDVTSAARLLRVPPLPELPQPLRGRNLVVIDAAILGDEAAGVGLLRELRGLRPEIDTFGVVPPAALSRLHLEPEQPIPHLVDSRLLDEPSGSTIEALVDAAGPGSGSPLAVVELRQLGGAVARRTRGAGALAALDGSVALLCGGLVTDAHMGAAVDIRMRTVFDAVRGWDAGRRYGGFVESRPVDTRRFFPADVYERLRRIKADVDPDGLLLANHPIPTRVTT